MNRIMSALLITLVTVIAYSMYQQQDVGYIQIRFAEFSFESNLLVLLAASLVVLFVFSLLYHVLRTSFGWLARFGGQRKLRLQHKARQALTQGLIELAEGRFERAEKVLLSHIKYSDNPLLAYLGAARAAQQQGAHSRRDKYLRLAHEAAPEADIAISLTQAELQLAHQQYEQALATLSVLAERAPKHTYVIKLLARTYQQLQDWTSLYGLVADIKKFEVFPGDETLRLEAAAWKGMLNDIAARNNLDTLTEKWQQLPRHLQSDADITAAYARLLLKLDATAEAENTLRQYLNKQWDDDIMKLYAELDVVNDSIQLDTTEAWLQQHPHNAHLLYTLGNLCVSRALWGKARNYYEASLAIQPLPETYLHLARLLEEHMHDPDAAQEYYRQGLHLLVGLDCERELAKLPPSPAEDGKPALKVV